MNKINFYKSVIFSYLLFSLAGLHAVALTVDSGWVSLFEKDSYEGWYVFEQGKPRINTPTASNNLFKWQADGTLFYGEGAKTYIGTKKQYTRYHFRVDYKFGPNCSPGETYCLNAGIFYYVTNDKIWPGVESNMYKGWPGSGFTGSFDSHTSNSVAWSDGNPNSFAKNIAKTSTTDWNTMEILVYGKDSAIHIVNGKRAFKGVGYKNGNGTGSFVLQGEQNDVWYRNAEVRYLDSTIKYLGCTDTNATNYEEAATHDDSSCVASASLLHSEGEHGVLVGNTVHLNNTKESLSSIVLLDVRGEQVHQWKTHSSNVYKLPNNLPSGFYWVHTQYSNGSNQSFQFFRE